MPDLKRTHEADVLLLYVILLNADSRTINWPAVAEAIGITQSAARLKWYRLKQELDLKIEPGGFDYRDMRAAEAQSGGDGDKDAGGFSMKVTTTAAATTTAAEEEEEEPRSYGKPKGQQQSHLKKERKKKKKSAEIVQDAESVLFSNSSSAGSDGDVDEDDWVDGTRGGRRKSFVFYAGGRGDKSGEIKSGGDDVSKSKQREVKVMGSQERVSCWSSDSSLVKVGISGDDSQGEACAIYSDEDHGGNMEVKEGEKAADSAATQENGIDKVKEGAVE